MLIIEENASISKVTKVIDKETLYDLLSYTEATRLLQYGNHITYVKKSAFDRRTNSFGTGLIPFIKRKLEAEGTKVEVKNISEEEKNYLTFTKEVKLKGIVLEDYQERILKLIETKRTGVIEAPTSAGKTIIIAGIIKKFKIPRTIIIVPTGDIARNTVRELEKLLGIKVGLFGDGKKELKRVTVMLYQSMKRIPDLKELGKHCDTILWDECHLAINAIEDILKNFHSTWYRYGLTATSISSARKSKWFHLTGQLGEKIITVTDKQAKKRVTDIDAFMFPFIGKSTSDDYLESYRPDVILNENRNKLISKMTTWAFKEKKVSNVLILVDEYKQAKQIHKFLTKDQKIYSEIASSKISSEKLEDMKKRFCNKELDVIIATTTFSVGTNLPETECILLGSARKSNTNTLQKTGRGRRKITNKEVLLLLDIYDKIGNKDRYFQKFSEKRLSLYKRKKWFREFINL